MHLHVCTYMYIMSLLNVCLARTYTCSNLVAMAMGIPNMGYYSHFLIIQVFYPVMTDIYHRKNMPKLIYCLHALRYVKQESVNSGLDYWTGVLDCTEHSVSTHSSLGGSEPIMLMYMHLHVYNVLVMSTVHVHVMYTCTCSIARCPLHIVHVMDTCTCTCNVHCTCTCNVYMYLYCLLYTRAPYYVQSVVSK